MKKSKISSKLMKMGLAAAGGVGGNVLTGLAEKIPFIASQDVKIKKAIPLIGAFFLMDFNEPAALGMCGSAGGNVGHEFGIGDALGNITEDDLSGLDDVVEVGTTDVGSALGSTYGED